MTDEHMPRKFNLCLPAAYLAHLISLPSALCIPDSKIPVRLDHKCASPNVFLPPSLYSFPFISVTSAS